MKRILFTLTFFLFSTWLINAQNKIENNKDSIKTTATTVSYTPTYNDTDESSETVISTVNDADSIINDDDSFDSSSTYRMTRHWDFDDFGDDFGDNINKSVVLGFFAILLIFGTPVIIVALALYFRYKNRRNRYRIIEKALEAGQPIPDEFAKENIATDTESKGIKNICLGLGLFIFLWALTNFAIGCIGIIIMCSGVGQYLVARKKRKSDQQ